MLILTFDHVRLPWTAIGPLWAARLQFVGKGTLANGLFFRSLTHLAAGQAPGERQQADQTDDITDEARQDQQATAHGQHQALEHLLGRQLAALQAFTGTQGRGQPGHAHHQHTQSRACDDQEQRRKEPDGCTDLEKHIQLQHREQEKQQ
ncbi:hypothetical protein D3C86_1804150 [compost metagenome]